MFAQQVEAARKANASKGKSTPGKRIDLNSPEGKAIARRFAKSKTELAPKSRSAKEPARTTG